MESRFKELEILISKFVRQLPQNIDYEKRLEEEWQNLPVPYSTKHDPTKLQIVQTYNEFKDSVKN